MLKDFLTDQIRELYWSEKFVLEMLPALRQAASSDALKNAFESNRQVTEEHVARLEQIFRILGDSPRSKKCDAVDIIMKESETAMEEFEDGIMQDVALIVSAQKLQHYKIGGYRGLLWIAGTLGLNEAADLFEATLTEEEEADQILLSIAQTQISLEPEDD